MNNKNIIVRFRNGDDEPWREGDTIYTFEEWIDKDYATPKRQKDGIVWFGRCGQQRIYGSPLEQEIMLAEYEKSKRKASKKA